MRPADNGRAPRFTLDGTAMDADEADAELSTYDKGVAHGLSVAKAREDREERRWRLVFAAILSALVISLAIIAREIASRLDAITGVIQTHSEATWQRSQGLPEPSQPTRDR